LTREWAELAVGVATLYVLIGALFGLFFVTLGAQRIDPAARGAGWGFRLLIFPGVAALWPLLAWRWRRAAGEPPTERNAHRAGKR
jgi:hypothetical protein